MVLSACSVSYYLCVCILHLPFWTARAMEQDFSGKHVPWWIQRLENSIDNQSKCLEWTTVSVSNTSWGAAAGIDTWGNHWDSRCAAAAAAESGPAQNEYRWTRSELAHVEPGLACCCCGRVKTHEGMIGVQKGKHENRFKRCADIVRQFDKGLEIKIQRI